MQKLPIGISSFEVIRTGGYLYVDKTEWIHRLVTEGMYYSLARPRQFGKSLLVATLKCLFEGRQELFKDLWIAARGEWVWAEHPVIVIDFNDIAHDTPDNLRLALETYLARTAERFQLTLKSPLLVSKFQELIYELNRATGMPVAVLIDEYDKPLISHLGRGAAGLEIARANRDILQSFFGVLKAATVATALRFVFLTGISYFRSASVFSGLNNLNNISMHGGYAALLGYTQAELEHYFARYIQQLGTALGCTVPEVQAQLAQQYDGYRFSEKEVRVYNPLAILKAFAHKQLQAYWFETGNPAFVVKLLKEQGYNPADLEALAVTGSVLTAFDLEQLSPLALLFQLGYLTIKDVEGRLYTLGYPNQEVKTAFTAALLAA